MLAKTPTSTQANADSAAKLHIKSALESQRHGALKETIINIWQTNQELERNNWNVSWEATKDRLIGYSTIITFYGIDAELMDEIGFLAELAFYKAQRA